MLINLLGNARRENAGEILVGNAVRIGTINRRPLWRHSIGRRRRRRVLFNQKFIIFNEVSHHKNAPINVKNVNKRNRFVSLAFQPQIERFFNELWFCFLMNYDRWRDFFPFPFSIYSSVHRQEFSRTAEKNAHINRTINDDHHMPRLRFVQHLFLFFLYTHTQHSVLCLIVKVLKLRDNQSKFILTLYYAALIYLWLILWHFDEGNVRVNALQLCFQLRKPLKHNRGTTKKIGSENARARRQKTERKKRDRHSGGM